MPNGRGLTVKVLRSLPKQKLVTVIMSNGASISMPMAVRKFMNKYRMTVDPTNHPLWSGKKAEVRTPVPACPSANPNLAAGRMRLKMAVDMASAWAGNIPSHECMHSLSRRGRRSHCGRSPRVDPRMHQL